MSLTALERTVIHYFTLMFSEGSQMFALTKSSAALKMYLSYLGLLRIMNVLLSYSMYQFISVLIQIHIIYQNIFIVIGIKKAVKLWLL